MQVAIGSYQLQEVSLIGEAVNPLPDSWSTHSFSQSQRDELDHRFTVLPARASPTPTVKSLAF